MHISQKLHLSQIMPTEFGPNTKVFKIPYYDRKQVTYNLKETFTGISTKLGTEAPTTQTENEILKTLATMDGR